MLNQIYQVRANLLYENTFACFDLEVPNTENPEELKEFLNQLFDHNEALISEICVVCRKAPMAAMTFNFNSCFDCYDEFKAKMTTKSKTLFYLLGIVHYLFTIR